MKTNTKFTVIVVLAFLLMPYNKVLGQYHALKVNAIGLFSGLNLGYEFGLSEHVSIGISGHTIDYNYLWAMSNDENVTGWGFTPEIRYYPLKGKKYSPAGFFAGTYLRYRFLTGAYSNNDATKFNGEDINIGLCAGYKIVLNHFFIEFLGGVGHSFGDWNDKEQKNYDNYNTGGLLSSNGNIPFKYTRLEVSLGLLFPVKDKE